MEMAQSTSINKSSSEAESQHLLSDKWVLWAHLPHDTDWTLKSYINIVEFDTVEKVIAVINTIPPTMIKNCMLFVMKKGIMVFSKVPNSFDISCSSPLIFEGPGKVWESSWGGFPKASGGF